MTEAAWKLPRRSLCRAADVLEGGMLARCPSCRNTFSTDRAGRQNCPVCGKPLLVPEPPEAVAAAELVSETPGGTPWENRAQGGSLAAWGQTIQQALFEPGKLFRSARIDRSGAQLGFAVLTISVAAAVGQILERLLSARMGTFYERLGDRVGMSREMFETARQLNSPGVFVALLVLLPAFVFVAVYLNAFVTHFFALILGQAKRGFAATFAACAYASAPLLLLALPVCGSFIAVPWFVVLTGIGLKETHRITAGRAAGITLAPYLLLCCATMVAAMAAAVQMQKALGGGP